MSGTAYAIAALVLFGLGDFVFKRAADAGVKTHHFIMVQAWFFSSSIFVYALLTGRLVLGLPALWGSLAGVFMLIGYTNFSRSLSSGAVSINAPIFRLNFIITAVLAIAFLGEALTLPKIAALILALAAAWLLLGGGNGKPGAVNRRSLLQVIVATFALGIGNIFLKVGLQHGALPETLVTAQAAVVVSFATLTSFTIDRRIAPEAVVWRYSPLAALALVTAFVFLLRGLAQGEASVLVPIAQMGFIVTAGLGVVMLREPFTLRKMIGLAAAAGALGLFAAS
jgi:uncharacterized membrane protein